MKSSFVNWLYFFIGSTLILGGSLGFFNSLFQEPINFLHVIGSAILLALGIFLIYKYKVPKYAVF
ncbi:MAG TPA: hypothetical protein VJH20_00600 [Candidatus Nanoarchaeia archaeon]|nr:hypothetical protein [Candidatus Nanoarchaeia archaeon]